MHSKNELFAQNSTTKIFTSIGRTSRQPCTECKKKKINTETHSIGPELGDRRRVELVELFLQPERPAVLIIVVLGQYAVSPMNPIVVVGEYFAVLVDDGLLGHGGSYAYASTAAGAVLVANQCLRSTKTKRVDTLVSEH